MGERAAEAMGDGAHERATAPMGAGASADVGPELARIGAYRLIRVLGEGGFGSVYLAEQESPKRLVAVKVLKAGAASRQALARFEHEAQTLARLRHPGIAQVLEAGFYDVATGEVGKCGAAKQRESDTGGRRAPFFAMEYVRGEMLTSYAKRQGLKPREVVELVIKVCEAVQHAHNNGVIHRDLKPANILVDQSGQPKVLDFGVARVSDEDVVRVTARTDVGQMIGTLPYMSPEQVAADPTKVDTRSDVYALGVVLYELLTGRLPYDVERKLLHEATRTICEATPTRLGLVSRAYKGDLETIAGKALEKERERRYQSGAALAEDLRRYLNDEPIVARPPSTAYQWRKFAKRNKALVGGIAGIMVALAAGAVAASVLAVRATAARQRAEREADKARAVTGFLEETLALADPDKKGKDVRLADVLEGAAGEIETQLSDKPEAAAALHKAVARAYKGLGLFDTALAQGREALRLLRGAGRGEDDPDVLEARRVVARILEEQSKLKESEAELTAVREAWLKRAGGRETEESLNTLSDLAGLHGNNGQLEQAEAEARRALDGFRTLSGKDSEEALAHELLLGEVLDSADKAEEAEGLLARVLEVRQRTLDAGDVRIQNARDALGGHYRMSGRYDKAAEVWAASVAAYEKKYGPEHPKTLSKRTDLGKALQQAGKLAEAEVILRPNVEALKRVQGPDHFDTLTCEAFLGDTLQAARKLPEAEAVRREMAQARVRTLGPDHPQTLAAWTNLGLIVLEEGKYADAEAIFRDLLERRERVFGPEHAEVGVSTSMMGYLYLAQRDGARAEPYYRRCVAIRAKLLPEGNGIRGISMSALGHALALQGKNDEAEPLLTTGAEWVLADARAPGKNKRDAVARVVELYEKWGRGEQAERWRGRMPG